MALHSGENHIKSVVNGYKGENKLEEYVNYYKILDMQYDRLAELASVICNAPVSFVTFADKNELILKGVKGVSLEKVPREGSFCDYTLNSIDGFDVPDTAEDSRFPDELEITNEFTARSYCGHSITDDQGEILGTICVLDSKPREFSPEQKRGIAIIAEELTSIIIKQKRTQQIKYQADEYKAFFENSKGLMCAHALDGSFLYVNEASANSIEYTIDELTQMSLYDIIPHEYHHGVDVYLKDIKKNGKSTGIMTVCDKNGTRKMWLYNNVVYDAHGEKYVMGNALDITTKNKLEEEHRRLKEMLEQTNTVAKIGGWEVDLVNQQVYWSSITKMLHEVPTDFVPDITKGINFYKEGYSRDAIAKAIDDAVNKGMSWDLELQIVTATGNDKWVRAIGNAEFENDLCVRLYGTFQDVDAQKKAEIEIKNSRKLIDDTMEAASEVSIISTTTEGIITVFNKGAENLLGYTAKEMIGKRTPAVIHAPAEVEARATELSEEYDQEISGFRVFVHKCEIEGSEQREWTYIRKDGTEFPVSLVITPIRDTEGVIQGYLGIAIDISERKKAEYEVGIERARLSAFVTHAPAAVAMFDTDIKYIAYSNRWLEEYQIGQKNISGLSHYEIFPNIGQEWKDIHQRSLKGEVIANEEDRWRPPGWDHDQYLRWEVRPWYQFDGSIGGIMMLTQDITAACMQREELEKAKLQAEQASIAKSEFLANMSHEIRTPLNGVIGFTDLVLKTDLTETQHQYLTIVEQSGNSLLSIINDILDFSKIEAGRLELDIDKFDIYELNNQASDIISFQVQEKGLEMLLNISTALPRFIYADNVRLKQVLVNLLGNATKFTEKGEIELKVSPVTISEADQLITIRFEVRDTGIGIKEEKQAKIFEAFSQEDISTTKKYGGTGLGLTISNRLLELMDSKLQLDSEPGKGSTFYFDITVKYEDGDAIQWEGIDAISRVLIVDDNQNNRTIIKEMLALKNIEAEEAKNGFEALEFMSADKEFDLVLMDYHMPFMDGIETACKIRENFNIKGKNQPIIFLHSSSDDQKIIKKCKELNIQHRLIKPIKIEDLYRAMSQLFIREEVINNTKDDKSKIDKPLHVLIVEDNSVNMLLAEATIKKVLPKAKVFKAIDGVEALEKCAEKVPEIIFMDIQMPNMNGYDATKEIRKLYGDDVLIFALTAGNVKGEKEKCLSIGMNDFITKPFVEDNIAEIINSWIKNDQTSDSDKVFDINKLYEYLGDNMTDKDIVKNILEALTDELSKAKESLESTATQTEASSLKKIGHKLYGTASTVGLLKLAEVTHQLDIMDIHDSKVKNNIQNLSADLLAEIENGLKAVKYIIGNNL